MVLPLSFINEKVLQQLQQFLAKITLMKKEYIINHSFSSKAPKEGVQLTQCPKGHLTSQKCIKLCNCECLTCSQFERREDGWVWKLQYIIKQNHSFPMISTRFGLMLLYRHLRTWTLPIGSNSNQKRITRSCNLWLKYLEQHCSCKKLLDSLK